MNHLNNLDKFEQKLREQFDNFEAKPNDALWENIAQNIPTDNFEKTVATKLNTLKFEPNESIWLSIEKRLPLIVQVNKNLIYFWTFVVLSFGIFAGIFINKMMNNSKTSGAMSHPKAFVWLEENKQLAIGNKQTEYVKNNIESQAIITNKKPNKLLFENVVTENLKSNFRVKKYYQSNSVVVTQSPFLSNNETVQNPIETVDGLPLIGAIVSVNLPLSNKVKIDAENSSVIANNNVPSIVENSPIIAKNTLLEPTKDTASETTNLTKVENIVTLPKTKAVLTQQVSDENYTGVSLKKEKLIILAYGGLGYSFVHYSAGNNQTNIATNQKLREQTESSESEITGGFLVGYDLTKRFTISSGLIIANFKQKMSFSKETAKNPNGNYEENLIYFNDTITVGNSNSTSLKYSFTEIPLFITYKVLETQKFELAFQTGLGIGFVTGINTYIINSNNIGVYEITNKDDFPAFKNTLFFSFQPQFTYNLNSPGVSVGIMPIIKTSLTNIVSDENWLKQYPYNMSMNVFLRKRF
jgi:hypothetical protein